MTNLDSLIAISALLQSAYIMCEFGGWLVRLEESVAAGGGQRKRRYIGLLDRRHERRRTSSHLEDGR